MDNFTYKLKILTQTDNKYLELFEKAALPDLILTDKNEDAEILLAAPPVLADCINDFPAMQWVQSTYAGVDALLTPGLPTHYELTNVKGIFGQQISEYVLGYTIAHFRHFDTYRLQQAEKQWHPHHYQTLAGKKVFILGTGAIGGYLARALAALNLYTVGVNRTGIPPKESAFNEIIHKDQLLSRLNEAEVIVSVLPGTPETQGMFNQEFFNNCNGSLLFNVGRGSAVDTPALLEALESGRIAHAFLDVFINEPISQQCPYWHNPKVTVTPHIAAYSFPEQVFDQFRENYLRWRDGFALLNRIDFDKGY